jgi:hypothetical protein
MKKKILGGIALSVIAAAAALNVNFNSQNISIQYALENIEAQANPENTGLSVRSCYHEVYSDAGAGSTYIKCDYRTTSSTIYNCPAPISGRSYSGGCDKCINN